jgi:hypothetical protein
MAAVDSGEECRETESLAQTKLLLYPKKKVLVVFALLQFGKSIE